ncbi:DUF4031 domain-containing protein [Achromobacter xylosoxidans]
MFLDILTTMTIYVDSLHAWGWRMRGRTVDSCHMFTDSLDLEELHCFAERIGMRREWFQQSRVAPHYDLTPNRRAKAVSLGAVEVLDRRRASEIWRARREAVARPDACAPGPQQPSLF